MPPDLRIFLLDARTQGALARVADGVFDDPIRPDSLATFLAAGNHHMALATCGDEVVGMASAVSTIHPDKLPELWINEVGVAAAHQRQGIGRRLLGRLLELARHLGCREAWVLADPDNAPALALYRAVASPAGTSEASPAVMLTWRTGPGA